MEKQIKLRDNAKSNLWQLCLKLLFAAFFAFKLFFVEHLGKNIFNEQPYKTIITIFFIIYFVSGIIDILKFTKRDKTPKIALTNEKGITDYLQFKELGTIPWQDIEFIGIKNKFWMQYLIIKVKNPLDYINKVAPNFKLKNN